MDIESSFKQVPVFRVISTKEIPLQDCYDMEEKYAIIAIIEAEIRWFSLLEAKPEIGNPDFRISCPRLF